MPDQERARTPLTKELILKTAIDIADRRGLGALTMRHLGTELGVEAMSLYKHVANKDAILGGILELVIGEIGLPNEEDDWREAMRTRAIATRRVLSRHVWAIGLMEARRPRGPVVLGYLDAILGSLRAAGFSIEDAAHAFWLLDSYVYGHVIQESSMPLDSDAASVATSPAKAGEYPHLVEVAEEAFSAGYSFDTEFDFGLELILDSLEGLHGSRRVDV